MDKTLEEYARENKIGARRGGNRRGGRGGRGFNNNNKNNNVRRQGGGVEKRNSRGNGPRSNGSFNNNGSRFRRPGGLSSGVGLTKLIIANLDFGVTDSDIKGLFSEFGKIRKAAVHYDRTGRSLGTADILYDRKSDAIRALSHYNGVSLDGRPMNIQLTTSLSALSSSGRGGRGGARRGGRGGRGTQRRGTRQQNQSKTAADLDADLDAHTAKMQTD
ncbi:unnamed protein product [Brachionus calyciflorus]|uniref:RRM domain-containing protein n=1 Tax=Brachionus calyciflorus TaxID=104777 RepID=A0A814ED06_9BILA|nr:unnamed protein product [Brachionus calyciflorus]